MPHSISIENVVGTDLEVVDLELDGFVESEGELVGVDGGAVPDAGRVLVHDGVVLEPPVGVQRAVPVELHLHRVVHLQRLPTVRHEAPGVLGLTGR